MVGVGNDASTVVVVERFGWRLLGPMPVRVCLPAARASGIVSTVVNPAFLASDRLASLCGELDWVPVTDWVQSWDIPFLRWRLSRPGTRYVFQVGDDAIAISTRTLAPGRIPVAVLLKVFPRPGASLPVDGAAYVAAACRAQRAPICVYAGHNAHVRVRGITPPRRLQPSPLNVVLKPLDDDRVAPDAFRLDTFEFLDMDAY